MSDATSARAAASPARAAGADARSSRGGCRHSPSGRVVSAAAPLTVRSIVFAILLPFLFTQTSGFLNATIIALAYVVMALGLNIVVGFAGLLDLGYVAFYAIGAYIGGLVRLRRSSSNAQHPRRRLGDVQHTLPGIHLNFLLIVLSPRC